MVVLTSGVGPLRPDSMTTVTLDGTTHVVDVPASKTDTLQPALSSPNMVDTKGCVSTSPGV